MKINSVLKIKWRILFSLLMLTVTYQSAGQNFEPLKQSLKTAKNSKERLKILREISDTYLAVNPDSAMHYAKRLSAEAVKAEDRSAEAYAMGNIGECYMKKGDNVNALKLSFEALEIFKEMKDSVNIANMYNGIANIYGHSDPELSYKYYTKCRKLSYSINSYLNLYFSAMNLAIYFEGKELNDSAFYYSRYSIDLFKKHKVNYSPTAPLLILARLHNRNGQKAESRQMFIEAIHIADIMNDGQIGVKLNYAGFLAGEKELDSALVYANEVKAFLKKNPQVYTSINLNFLLSHIYRQKNMYKEALDYQTMAMKTNDSLNYADQGIKVAAMTANEEQRIADIKRAEEDYREKLKMYGIAGVLAVVLLLLWIVVSNNKKQKKANRQLEGQKIKIEQTLADLQLTQNQLIQSEKMASLGELTAGIAHEIQNPLNFVNNFSDVSVELLEELDEEAKAGNTEDVLAISSDLKLNLEKIAHHGRRADNIVKGMLQHSRASTGQKEPTDVNALADEYFRLAYHGLRAKDKSFNADLVTNFAEGLPKVNIIPQDVGRVLLNLFTNAFYATQEKSKQSQSQSRLAGYKPVVTVSTKQVGDTIEITVKDNGTGIPDAIKDKILQPFFTTKPTGEGTGLGLSLSYDIVVKGHGGSIDIASVEGEGSEFIIKLSI
jgi:two-component system, NtrC family, sensor kinase